MIAQLFFLASGSNGITEYDIIIGGCLIILLSYSFDYLSKSFRVPSVILLIGLGMGLAWGVDNFIELSVGTLRNTVKDVLSYLGTIGLILIVLEAALDLKLQKEKIGMILRSFGVALFVLLLTVFAVAEVLMFYLHIDSLQALVYATPLSIMSSAIVIPSVGNLVDEKREFMIYEATFSDILGIILFFFLIEFSPGEVSMQGAMFDELLKILATIVVSLIISYGLVYFISKVTKKANFFTIFAILLLFYAVGKKYHLSSLITILIFGLVLYNEKLFFQRFLSRLYSKKHHARIIEDFKLLTHQSAFLVRTFFFVAFGMIISVQSLFNIEVLFVSFAILVVMYFIRYAHLQFAQDTSIFPEVFISPRGLITVLLFFQIPEDYKLDQFNEGIMFDVIIFSSLIMMVALMFSKQKLTVIEDFVLVDNNQITGYGRDSIEE